MATKGNIYIDAGSTYSTGIKLLDGDGNPISISGYTANSQIRKDYSSLTAVNFVTNLTNGLLTLSLDANTSANMTPGRYVYDVKLVAPNGTSVRLVEGIVTVNPQVTT